MDIVLLFACIAILIVVFVQRSELHKKNDKIQELNKSCIGLTNEYKDKSDRLAQALQWSDNLAKQIGDVAKEVNQLRAERNEAIKTIAENSAAHSKIQRAFDTRLKEATDEIQRLNRVVSSQDSDYRELMRKREDLEAELERRTKGQFKKKH